MTTSGSYDITSTMRNIIYDAFAAATIIDDAETMSADKWDYGKRKLNEFMATLSIHSGLWQKTHTTVTLTPGTVSYNVGVGLTINTPKPKKIAFCRRVQTDLTQIPIEVVSESEYLEIPNKTLQAPPNMVYYDRQRDNGVLYVWPTGTTTDKTIIITTHRPIQDFDDAGNNPDLPKEWVLCITYQLATLIAPKYLGGIIPADIKIIADQLMSALMIDDEEKTSVFFA